MPDAAPVTDTRTIAKVAREVLADVYPGWTDEQLLYHPEHAIDLCRRVRGRTGRRLLKDHDIPRAMVNERKRGRAGSGRRQTKK